RPDLAGERHPDRGDAVVPRRGHPAPEAVVGPDAEQHGPRVHGAGALAGDLPGPGDQPGRACLQPLRRHPARRLGPEAPPQRLRRSIGGYTRPKEDVSWPRTASTPRRLAGSTTWFSTCPTSTSR